MLLVVNAIEAIADRNSLSAAFQPTYNGQTLQQQLLHLLADTEAWLRNTLTLEQLEQRLESVNLAFVSLKQCGEHTAAKDCQNELAKLRLLITRMHTSRISSFLGPAYAMLEIFLVGAVAALLLIQAKLFTEVLVVSYFLFTSFTYLLLLIRDLDNPFQYNGRSSVDADLSPLNSCRLRLLASSLPTTPAS